MKLHELKYTEGARRKESVSAVVKVLVTERLLVRGTRDKMLVAVVEFA